MPQRMFGGTVFRTPEKHLSTFNTARKAVSGRTLRIAQVAPLAEAVPPKLYGGTERVVSWLTEELVRQGHDVTLFASGDSETSAKLVPCAPQALRLAGIKDHTAANLVMLNEVLKRQRDFDVIHFHTDFLHFPLFQHLAGKTVTTLHNRQQAPDFRVAYEAFPQMPLVSISDDYRNGMPDGLNWAATVHHGTPTSVCPYNADGGDYLAFLGRMSPEKRPDRAIRIAMRSGIPLKMAAKVDAKDQEYYDTQILPLIAQANAGRPADAPLVEFIGEINEREKCGFLGHALALLFPIDWPEPFGLVMIEAMSAGTPVIAWKCGSVPEIVRDGISGYAVSSEDEAVQAVHKVKALQRPLVRDFFETRFSAKRMALSYVRVYEGLLQPAMMPMQPRMAVPQASERSAHSVGDGLRRTLGLRGAAA